MKKRPQRKQFSRNIVILLIIFIVIVVGYYLIANITKKIAPPSTELDRVLEPIPDKLTVTTAKLLKGVPNYKKRVNVKQEIKSYIDSFTVRKYEETAPKIIGFQDKINGLDIKNALAIDTDLAGSLETAAENVRINKENISKEQQSCGIFNGLLNPSLLVMDLTLWTGKSRIYPTLQQYQDVGVQCLFYYPQVSHGMFTYDVKTGRIVQRSVFCDPSETKSKCFGVWDYFWKYAVDPVEGPINYGVGCSLTDWMNQGFVCVNGIDLRTSFEGKIISTVFEYGVEGQFLGIADGDIKDEFQNALGASGKTIIDNVKQKCARVKEKLSKYGSIVPTLTGAGSSLTGGVISTATAATGTGEGLKEEYEKAMLFASLFSEACAANPSDLAKDLASGGGAGQFGLNKPNACILSAAPELGATGLKEEMQCVNHFFGPRGLEQVQNLDGLPDNQCLPSVGAGHPGKVAKGECATINSCGRSPTPEEQGMIDEAVQDAEDHKRLDPGTVGWVAKNVEFSILETEEEREQVCGAEQAACTNKVTKEIFIYKGDIDEPTHPTSAQHPKMTDTSVVYDFSTLVAHEVDHARNPDATEDDISSSDLAKGSFVQRDEEESENEPQSGNENRPAPDDFEPDECSAQAQKVDAVANCLEQSQLKDLFGKEGRKPAPDPFPPGDEVGGARLPPCDETGRAGGAGGYFGTKKNSADDCIIGDFCDFSGYMYAVRFSPNFNKKCQFVESSEDGGLIGKLPCSQE